MSISIHSETNEIRYSVTVRGVKEQITRVITIPGPIADSIGAYAGYPVNFEDHPDTRTFVISKATEPGQSDGKIWLMGGTPQLTITEPARECKILPGETVTVGYPIDGPERLVVRG